MGPAEPVREPVMGAAALRAMIGLAVVSAIALLLGLIWASLREGADAPGHPGDVVRVGVVQGQPVSGYLRSSRAERR